MVNREDALLIGAGAIGGIGITHLTRRFFDTNQDGDLRQVIPQLGTYGTPSSMVGIGTGIAGIAVGLLGDKLGVRDHRARTASVAYGATAIASGIVSGYSPKVSIPSAAGRARVVRSTSAPATVQRRAVPSAVTARSQAPRPALPLREPRTY